MAVRMPCFGGVNLEDLAQPKCFDILDTLRKKARIPIWHDDQQGTAAVTYAGLVNAVKLVGKELGAVESCNDAELMGFFCEDYSPEDPNKFLGPEAPG